MNILGSSLFEHYNVSGIPEQIIILFEEERTYSASFPVNT